jgi:hypothetical protein
MAGRYAPDAIADVFNAYAARYPSAVLSGVMGGTPGQPGYHSARNELPGDDYSVIQPPDQLGDGWACCGLDVSMNPADMQAATQQLIDATQARDPRIVTPVREFFGTVDGVNVTGLDTQGNYWITSDDSHLWHVHISFRRQYSNDAGTLQQFQDLVRGDAATGGGTDEDWWDTVDQKTFNQMMDSYFSTTGVDRMKQGCDRSIDGRKSDFRLYSKQGSKDWDAEGEAHDRKQFAAQDAITAMAGGGVAVTAADFPADDEDDDDG